MEKKTKQTLFFICFGVVLYAALINLHSVLSSVQRISELFFPIIFGLILAFVLSVPMKGFETILARIFNQTKYKPNQKFLSGISLIFTLLCIGLIIAVAATMAIPELTASVKSIYPLIEEKWPEWMSYLEQYNININRISEWAASIDIEKISNGAGILLGSAISAAASTISGIANSAFAIVIAIYTLLSKNILAVQAKKLVYGYLNKNTADKVLHVSELIRNTYSKFFSGQCVEAILLGFLIFLAYSIFRLPYAGLIAFLTGLFAFIPYIGAFGSCFIGAFLILLAEPSKVLLCVVVYMVVQFIENQFIYPNVVGNSVGLSPLLTLIATLVGGKLFGLLGIIFFIPLAAVLYVLVRENTNKRLEKKGYKIKTE